MSGRCGAILEDMPEMRVTTGAENFRSSHPVAEVRMRGHILLCKRLEETRPPCAGIKFRVRSEQGKIAAHAGVNAGFFVVVKSSAKGALGSFAAGNFKLFSGQLAQPGLIRFGDLLNSLRLGRPPSGSQQSHLHRSIDCVHSLFGESLCVAMETIAGCSPIRYKK